MTLPTGTVTFLFTDIEGSTKLLEWLGPKFPEVLRAHNAILEEAIEASGGFKVRSEGDSFFAVFQSAPLGVAAAVGAQRALAGNPWPEKASVNVRMGLHTGEGQLGGDDYVGIDVHRAARIAAIASGQQVLISETVKQLVEATLPETTALKDLGEHRLKDLPRPEHIYQIVIDGLRQEFPPIKSFGVTPNNLPPDLTSFVGRERELAKAKALLERSRLLTLTGPGGTGKTRLSLRIARDLLDDFADGVFFVELAPLTDGGLVASTVAQTLGLQEAGTKSVQTTISEFLDGKEILLVLDNFEQVLEAAGFVGDVLSTTVETKVLVTSRAPLHLSGEQEYPVPPLLLPDISRPPPFEKLVKCEAVALFAERASLARPDFELTEKNVLAVAEISSRLNGLPLALEIAAARSKLLSPEAMLTRLRSTLDIQGAGDAPQRQRTLRGAISWSYDLLDESMRQLFRRLSVFVGGWTLEDAEAVCNPIEELAFDVLSGMEFLLDQSLIKQQTGSTEPRFFMLEVIREFGLDRLREEDDAHLCERTHASVFAELARTAEPKFLGPDAAEWLDKVELDHDNLRSALRWTLDNKEILQGLSIASSLWRFWHLRGHLSEGRDWLSQLLELDEDLGTIERAKGLNALAGLIYWQSDVPGAKTNYEEALRIYRSLEDRDGIAEVLYSLGFIASIEMEYEKSAAIFAESEEIHLQMDNKEGAARSILGRGMAYQLAKENDLALTELNRAREALLELGLQWDAANAEAVYGKVLEATGDYEGAQIHHLKALDLYERLGDVSGIAFSLEYLARVAIDQSLLTRAITMEAAAHALKDSLGGKAPEELIEPLDSRGAARGIVSDEEISVAWEAGHAMTLQEALTFARKTGSVHP